MYLTFVCIFVRTQGESVERTPYYIIHKGQFDRIYTLSRYLHISIMRICFPDLSATFVTTFISY